MKKQRIFSMGKYFYAAAIGGIGIEQLLFENFPAAFMLSGEPSTIRLVFVYMSATLLASSALLIMIRSLAPIGAFIAGIVFLSLCLFSTLPPLTADLHNGGVWTLTAEMLLLSAGAFILLTAGMADTGHFKLLKIPMWLRHFALICLAISLFIFAILHYVYADYIVTLIPVWVPGKVLLNYLIMIGFAAASVSILTGFATDLAGICIGCMLLIFVLILHIPRCISNPGKEAEWTSLLIALAMSGTGFLLAGSCSTRLRIPSAVAWNNHFFILPVLFGISFLVSCNRTNKQNQEIMKSSKIEFISPTGLHNTPAYSQAVVVSGDSKTIYVGGQNAVDSSGALVGKGDFKMQVEQTLKNLRLALEGSGAKPENVVKWNMYVVQGQSFQEGFEVFQRVWGKSSNSPIVTGVYVAGLTNPDYLVEIEAVAVVAR